MENIHCKAERPNLVANSAAGSRTPTLYCSHTIAVKINMTIFTFVIGTMSSESLDNCQVLQLNHWDGQICSGSWEAELNAKSCFALFDLESKLFSSLSKAGEGGWRMGRGIGGRHLCVLQSFLLIQTRLVVMGAWSLENCCLHVEYWINCPDGLKAYNCLQIFMCIWCVKPNVFYPKYFGAHHSCH